MGDRCKELRSDMCRPAGREQPRSVNILADDEMFLRYSLVMTIRAHFDGRVIVPDEPLDLPKDARFEVNIRSPRKKEFSIRKKNGIPLARNDRVAMTAKEVAAMLEEV